MSLLHRLFRRDTPLPNGQESPAASLPGGEQEGEDPSTVVGERGIPSIHRSGSIQSRVSNIMAIGLMGLVGVGLLAWYYTQTFARHARAQEDAQSASRTKVKGEMSLPPLGRVDPPVIERVLGPPPEMPAEGLNPVPSLEQEPIGRYSHASSYGAARTKTPEDLALERRLSGPVVVTALTSRTRDGGSAAGRSGAHTHESETAERTGGAGNSTLRPLSAEQQFATTRSPDELAGLLEPSVTPAAQAQVLPTQRLLMPKGAFLDCTLETAIDSTLPGMTTCITATDTFSADGTVVLLERGTKLVGETKGQVRQGAARVYVLWTEARTPTGVVVPLASPGTDELGRSGLPGEVDRHFWERFGAAILVSVIDGAVQGAVQDSSGGTVIINPSGSQQIMTEVLRSTINIPPTVRKQNGDRIAVLVARDLDFRTVYELRPATAAR